tara:strand:- start:408 stop:887 length:480 start_codon:yes stop_codon:yes gene_type:complete
MTGSAGHVELREPRNEDFETVFALTQNPVANEMAKVLPRSREDYETQWAQMLHGEGTVTRLIECDAQIVGCINSFPFDRETQVGYLIAQEYWGKGIGTRALLAFLEVENTRPLFAHVAKSNTGSRRMLERCGFTKIDERDSPETERYMACVACLYRLDE